MLNSKSIGNKIAEARKKINLSQAKLAQHVSTIFLHKALSIVGCRITGKP